LAQHLDPFVLEPDLHQQGALQQAPTGQLAQRLEVVRRDRVQHQVIARRAGGPGRTGDEVGLGRAQPAALVHRQHQADQRAAPAGQPAGHRVRLVVQLEHGREDLVAGALGDRPSAGEDVGNRADRDLRQLGNIVHRGHRAPPPDVIVGPSASSADFIEAFRRSVSTNVGHGVRVRQWLTKKFIGSPPTPAVASPGGLGAEAGALHRALRPLSAGETKIK
jgi:hypothetical protein